VAGAVRSDQHTRRRVESARLFLFAAKVNLFLATAYLSLSPDDRQTELRHTSCQSRRMDPAPSSALKNVHGFSPCWLWTPPMMASHSHDDQRNTFIMRWMHLASVPLKSH